MSAKATLGDVSIPPRNLSFDVEPARNAHWLGGDPVGTAVFNALSLTFPDGERMFMDAVRHYRDGVTGKLADDVRGFIAQEAIHAREHHHLNDLIDGSRYPVDDILKGARALLAYARAGGPMRTLIATISLEHFTAMMADVYAENRDLFANVAPEIERLWRWHALEETEHKAVAYDVFLSATRRWMPWQRYVRRCAAMAAVTVLFTRNIAKFAAQLLEVDGYSSKQAKRAVRRYLWSEPGIFSRGWKIYAAWYRPGFHPWDHDNRALIQAWRREFDGQDAVASNA